VNTLREDPVRKGLLLAGSERAVYVSFNDGDDWQPLRLNMPATSIRDLVIHEDDVVVGTHGRSFWILDNITPLRQLKPEMASSEVFLFKPQTVYRVRWNMNTDTPLPPEEPAGKNPPDGAMVDFYFASDPSGSVTLEVFDQLHRLVRRYASTDKPEPTNEKELDVPMYWIRSPQILPVKAGMHRFLWDLHYPPPQDVPRSYPIAAIYRDTASEPKGPWVLPGEYTVKLTLNGRSYSQTFNVRMDPRVKTPVEGIRRQFSIALQCWEGAGHAHHALERIHKLRSQLTPLQTSAGKGPLADAIASLDQKLAALEGGPARRRRGPPGVRRSSEKTFSRLRGDMIAILGLVDEADAAPTMQIVAASEQLERGLKELMSQWENLRSRDLPALNAQLREAKLQSIALD
jgi:hypothetical protein